MWNLCKLIKWMSIFYTYFYAKKYRCFPEKFAQLTKLLHSRGSWRSRQISPLQTRDGGDRDKVPFSIHGFWKFKTFFSQIELKFKVYINNVLRWSCLYLVFRKSFWNCFFTKTNFSLVVNPVSQTTSSQFCRNKKSANTNWTLVWLKIWAFCEHTKTWHDIVSDLKVAGY